MVVEEEEKGRSGWKARSCGRKGTGGEGKRVTGERGEHIHPAPIAHPTSLQYPRLPLATIRRTVYNMAVTAWMHLNGRERECVISLENMVRVLAVLVVIGG